MERARAWRDEMALPADRSMRFNSFVQEHLWPQEFSSRRRFQAAQAVALTLADLDQSFDVKPEHVEEALQLAVHPFDKMSQGF